VVLRLFGEPDISAEVLRAALGAVGPLGLPPSIRHIWAPCLPEVFSAAAAEAHKEARSDSQAKLDLRQRRAWLDSRQIDMELEKVRLRAAHKAISLSWEQSTRRHAAIFLEGF
jgi:hypothetical protein